MKFLLKSALCLSFLLIVAASVTAQKKPAPMRFSTSGDYDYIHMNSKESGDYGGISVYLTQSADETFALVTLAEGTIFDPVLVDAKMSGSDMRTIEFRFPMTTVDENLKEK